MPWTGMIQTVESNYGSAVATYFKLMRSLLLATLLAGVLLVSWPLSTQLFA